MSLPSKWPLGSGTYDPRTRKPVIPIYWPDPGHTDRNTQKKLPRLKKDLTKRVDSLEARVETVESHVTNNRIKIAGFGGGAGLAVAIAVELLKLKTGG